jgi:nitrogen fixation NifU-like protein
MNNKNDFPLYSPKVMKYFLEPKNIGIIKNPDAVATVGNPRCGDVMKLYLKVGQKKNQPYIKDIKVQTLGCGAAIATSSVLTEMVKGKSLNEAIKITNQNIIEELGSLPPVKTHCSILAVEALKKAIESYRQKKK